MSSCQFAFHHSDSDNNLSRVINARSQCKLIWSARLTGVKTITHLVFIITQTCFISIYIYKFTFKGYLCSNYFTFVLLSNIKMAEVFLANTFPYEKESVP